MIRAWLGQQEIGILATSNFAAAGLPSNAGHDTESWFTGGGQVLIRINVGGLAAQEMGDLVAQVGGEEVEVRIVSDIEGAQEVAQGQADYYLGACATGAGGALSMAIAILGYSNCFTASTAGRPPKEAEIRKAVESGKVAFGFSSDHVTLAVPLIVGAILAKPTRGSP